jgi:hypothetical protein
MSNQFKLGVFTAVRLLAIVVLIVSTEAFSLTQKLIIFMQSLTMFRSYTEIKS